MSIAARALAARDRAIVELLYGSGLRRAELAGLAGEGLKAFRRQAQLVFQNPFDALNPRFTVRQSLAEPLRNARVPRSEREAKMRESLDRVHLPGTAATLEKYPHQLSGGQLQRVVLARALILDPDFIVADEPVSMLDVSVRAGILNVLREVRDALGLPRGAPRDGRRHLGEPRAPESRIGTFL